MNGINRRQFLTLTAGATTAAICAGGCNGLFAQEDVPSQRPNIIVLVTDDQRAGTMGCAGNPIIKTPNMDALANDGVMFTNAFVTTSICASSRASIFSGQWTSRHGIKGFATHFTPEALAQTYPMVLRDAGYRTGFIGKYGVGPKRDLPVEKYDYWRGFPGQGRYENKDENGDYIHMTRRMGNQAVEFLQGCSQDQPFCLSVSFKAPHCQDGDPRQFIPDPVYDDLYKDVTIPKPETADPKYFNALPPFLQDSEARNRWQIRFADDEMYQRSVKNYYRLITGVDTAIGRIRDLLKEKGLADNTVIMLIGDNGFYLGEYGLAGKWFPHEKSIRVPLFVYDPRAPKARWGRKLEQMALNVDIAPTVLDLAGVDAPEVMQGRSLAPLLQGKHPKWRTEFYYEHPFEHQAIAKSEAVRTKRWKYMRYPQYDHEELYDLKNDPDEVENLAGEAKHAKTLESLRRRCNELAAKTAGN